MGFPKVNTEWHIFEDTEDKTSSVLNFMGNWGQYQKIGYFQGFVQNCDGNMSPYVLVPLT